MSQNPWTLKIFKASISLILELEREIPNVAMGQMILRIYADNEPFKKFNNRETTLNRALLCSVVETALGLTSIVPENKESARHPAPWNACR